MQWTGKRRAKVVVGCPQMGVNTIEKEVKTRGEAIEFLRRNADDWGTSEATIVFDEEIIDYDGHRHWIITNDGSYMISLND